VHQLVSAGIPSRTPVVLVVDLREFLLAFPNVPVRPQGKRPRLVGELPHEPELATAFRKSLPTSQSRCPARSTGTSTRNPGELTQDAPQAMG